MVLFSADGVDYFIHIPASRAGGHHHKNLGYILAGADDRIINAGLNLYEEDENYKIWEAWYSKQRHTLPNWKRINSYDTEVRQRAVNILLQNIHSRAEAYVKEGSEVVFDMLLEGFEEAALENPSKGLYKAYEEEVIFAVGEDY
jgi:Fe-S cluster biosynthesis and repair protein YggX